MPKLISFDLVRNRRAWTDNAHVAAPDVEELRQFIKTCLPQHATEPSHAVVNVQLERRFLIVAEIRIWITADVATLISAVRGIVRVCAHRAELEEQKQPPIHA